MAAVSEEEKVSKTKTDDDHVQKYVEQLSRYYDPKRLQGALDRPVPALGGLTYRQMIVAGFGEVAVRVNQAGRTWESDPDLADLGVTPEVLSEARRRLGEPTP